ncbi:hypothetical protein OOG41_26525 [Bacillus sp. AS_5]|uniref:hypothetical protein n=1 Tax=unclassified Bacillus (in: firmicutes) TaxID=185979 RepID=UPI00224A7E85|nr:hypothetical protein [Bacillus sp. AS_3]MCW4657205.1 hypothetical protein [Bacillus sp. AS_3]MCX2704642.1 hypothetical protein [Bacillus sp. AS_5]
MNKKLLTTLTCFTLFMGLAACSFNETASTSKESKAEKAKKAEEKGTVKKEKAEQETAEKQEESTKKEQPTTTSGNTIKGLKEELSIGMPFKDYLAKKKSLNVENPFSISLGKGNVGSVLQAQDGVLVVCIDGEKIFDLKVFKTTDEVKAYEKSLKTK